MIPKSYAPEPSKKNKHVTTGLLMQTFGNKKICKSVCSAHSDWSETAAEDGNIMWTTGCRLFIFKIIALKFHSQNYIFWNYATLKHFQILHILTTHWTQSVCPTESVISHKFGNRLLICKHFPMYKHLLVKDLKAFVHAPVFAESVRCRFFRRVKAVVCIFLCANASVYKNTCACMCVCACASKNFQALKFVRAKKKLGLDRGNTYQVRCRRYHHLGDLQ